MKTNIPQSQKGLFLTAGAARLRHSKLLRTVGVLLCLGTLDGVGQSFSVLHHFGTNNSGVMPHGALIQDADGTFYGTMGKGGQFDKGEIFKMNTDGSGYTVLKDFNGSDGAKPEAALLLVGTTLYGTASGGYDYGTVYKLNTDGSGFTVLKKFYGPGDGASPYSALVVSGGMLYGTTIYGGSSNVGTIFRIGTDGSGYTVLKQLTGSDGAYPYAGLCLVGGTFYGTTSGGGAYNGGTVFKINPDGSGFVVLKEFPESLMPLTGLVWSGTRLYGTTRTGFTHPGVLGGTVFGLNPDGSGFTVLKEFPDPIVDPVGADGLWPNADLVLAGDRLYGRTLLGGMSGCGVIFTLKTDGSAFTVLKSFTTAEESPLAPPAAEWGSGLFLSGASLYGTSPKGGVGYLGTVFRIGTDGSGYVVLKQFTAGDGRQPYSGLAQGADGALYGTTGTGGAGNNGTVFKLNPDGSGYSTLKQFSGPDGQSPEAGVVISGTNLYGTTYSGGISNYGTVFSLNTDGSGYTVLKHFTSYDSGVFPDSLPALSGGTLYAGINYGKLWRMGTDGTGYNFLNIDPAGGYPGGLLIEGSVLYGTKQGSTASSDMVFRLNSDLTGFSVLATMGGSSGRSPRGRLALAGNTLFGAARDGGNFYNGTVFKLNTDGTGFAVLKQFTGGNDGGAPRGGVTLCGNTLYGTTQYGGSSGFGTVFKISTNGADFAVLKSFNGADGRYPYGDVLLIGTNLYGTAMYGGVIDQGTVFRLGVAPVLPLIHSVGPEQTAEAGSTAMLSVNAEGVAPLAYVWFFNDTNFVSAGTNDFLSLTDLQLSQAGAYTVVVTNLYGAATSAPVKLGVIAPIARRLVPGLTLLAQPGSSLNVQFTEALAPAANWTPLETVLVTNASQWCFDVSDPSPQRLYRAWQTNTGGPPPTLRLDLVPALTLTGSIGASVRLDYINQFGPVDAWVALDAVLFTNSSQFYFDISALGKPPRLWRAVPVP